MESKYKHYSPPGETDFKLVWDDYEKFFGVRPPAGNSVLDYDAAVRACDRASAAARLPGITPEPVAVWPSQLAAKEPRERTP